MGHEVPLHTQVPPTQAVPVGQAAPVPQLHTPAAEQLSAVRASHAVQALPARPQVSAPRTRQKPPAQQPSGHVVALQIPPLSV